MSIRDAISKVTFAQQKLFDKRNILRKRLLHHAQELPLESPGGWLVSAINPYCTFVDSLKDFTAAEATSAEVILKDLNTAFDELFFASGKSYFTPTAKVLNTQNNISKFNVPDAIFWASRDGFCNAYVRRDGSEWKELLNQQKRLWMTKNEFNEIITIASKDFDCQWEQLRNVLMIYHCEELNICNTYHHVFVDDLKLYLDPDDGTHFDLYWNFLDIHIPFGKGEFLSRRIPSMGIGNFLKTTTSIKHDALLKIMIASDDDGTANQHGAVDEHPIRIEEIRLNLNKYFCKLQNILPQNAHFKLDGWFNAQHFRLVVEQAGYVSALPSRANALTPWRRILIEGMQHDERIAEK